MGLSPMDTRIQTTTAENGPQRSNRSKTLNFSSSSTSFLLHLYTILHQKKKPIRASSMGTQNVNTPIKHKPSSSKVRVVVRVRPFLPHETATASRITDPRSCTIILLDRATDFSGEVAVQLKDPDTSRNECFRLDSYFGQDDDNVSQIFHKEVSPLVPGIFQGHNATVFAYGASGSGKTYTMQGSDGLPGLMPLSMSMVLSLCQRTRSTVQISFYEVYMDRCFDLLQFRSEEISILDDKDGKIHMKGLSKVPISSISEFYEVYSNGLQKRKVAHTVLNDVSSRSHGVLVIAVSTPCTDGSGALLMGKLNLIDLAGNEDNRRTCNESIRLQESCKINQSLFALSNVIFALNNNKPYVPYRESKLTRILQDSLGGTSHALMVACLNPGEYQESVHTVSLAARSRHITNSISFNKKSENPTVKIDMEAKLQAWLESKGKNRNAPRSPYIGKTPSSIMSLKNPNYNSSVKTKTASRAGNSIVQDGMASLDPRKLFNDESLKSLSENPNHYSNDDKDKDHASQLQLEPAANFTVEPSYKEEKKTGTTRSPLKQISSPINIQSSHSPECQSNTPKTCSSLDIGTPLNKLSARTCSLKESLVTEYLEFLNSASREELLGLKGIGPKLTEYILELRQTSPLKSLSDFEKVGLSSKQVQNVFSKAARGIFERPTSGCFK